MRGRSGNKVEWVQAEDSALRLRLISKFMISFQASGSPGERTSGLSVATWRYNGVVVGGRERGERMSLCGGRQNTGANNNLLFSNSNKAGRRAVR